MSTLGKAISAFTTFLVVWVWSGVVSSASRLTPLGDALVIILSTFGMFVGLWFLNATHGPDVEARFDKKALKNGMSSAAVALMLLMAIRLFPEWAVPLAVVAIAAVLLLRYRRGHGRILLAAILALLSALMFRLGVMRAAPYGALIGWSLFAASVATFILFRGDKPSNGRGVD